MTVNSLLKAALEPVAPVEADTYEGTEPTYITFGYISTPTDFGDDEPEHELFSISVHLFAPTGEDTIEKRRAIKKPWPRRALPGRAIPTPRTKRVSTTFSSVSSPGEWGAE